MYRVVTAGADGVVNPVHLCKLILPNNGRRFGQVSDANVLGDSLWRAAEYYTLL